MSYSFPKDAKDGDEEKLGNGVTYRYNKAKKSWQAASSPLSISTRTSSIHSLSHSKPRTTYGATGTYLNPDRPREEIYTPYVAEGSPRRSQLNSTSEIGMFGSPCNYSGSSMSVRKWSGTYDYCHLWFHPSNLDLSDAIIGDSLVLEASNGSMFVGTCRQLPITDVYTGWCSVYLVRFFIQGPNNPDYPNGETELKVYLADEKLNSKGHRHVVPRIAAFEDRYLKKWKSLNSNEFCIADTTSNTPSENSYLPGLWKHLKQIKLYGGMTTSQYEGGHDYVQTNNFGFITICAPTGSTFRPTAEQYQDYTQWNEYARTHERIPMYLGMTASSQRSNSGDKTFYMWNMELPGKDSHNPTENYVYTVKHIGIIDGLATVTGDNASQYSIPEELSDESDYLTANQMDNAVEEACEMAKENPEEKNLEDIKEEFQKLYGTQY